MRNIGFIVIVVIYAIIYIVRLARKARSQAPLPRAENVLPQEDDEEAEDTPAVQVRVPEPARRTGSADSRAALGSLAAVDSLAAADSRAAAKPADEDPAAASQGSLFLRLEKMTPLARAFVMSEVLGKPKGMDF
jgi:hypothetical protein